MTMCLPTPTAPETGRLWWLSTTAIIAARGRLKTSAPFVSAAEGSSEEATVVDIDTALPMDRQGFWSARDAISGLEFLLESRQLTEHGLEIHLDAWGCRVLTDFQPFDLAPELATSLMDRLGSNGTRSLAALRRDLELEPVRHALAAAMNPDRLERLMEVPGGWSNLDESDDLLSDLRSSSEELLRRAGLERDPIADRFLTLTKLPALARSLAASEKETFRQAGAGLLETLDRSPEILPTLYGWILLNLLQDAVAESPSSEEIPDWRLEASVLPGLVEAGGDPEIAARLVSVLQQALRTGWGRSADPAPEAMALQRQLLSDEDLRRVLGVNQYQGQEYISREALATLIDLRLLLEAQAWSTGAETSVEVLAAVEDWWQVLDRLAADAEASAYRTDELGTGGVVVAPTVDD